MATVTSAAAKPVTTSLKVKVTVEVSPTLRAVSSIVIETVGAILSTPSIVTVLLSKCVFAAISETIVSSTSSSITSVKLSVVKSLMPEASTLASDVVSMVIPFDELPSASIVCKNCAILSTVALSVAVLSTPTKSCGITLPSALI